MQDRIGGEVLGDYWYKFLSFVPLDVNAPKFFGFSEFLTGLAFMVLAWTIADVRYRFRVRTTPIPLQGITFAVMGAVGVLTLLTDLWRAEQWLAPQINSLTQSEWQAFLGGVFLLTFFTWAWFAFIRPPVYGRMNARRYARALYRTILKGSPAELSVIADEFAYSAKSLIKHATASRRLDDYPKNSEESKKPPKKLAKVTAYANDLLLLIADRRFCRAIVGSSPVTALAIFREIGEAKNYYVPIEVFARNIVNEAIANKDSFLFHEAEGYESGLLGYHKPLSQAIFANYRMVEAIGTLFEPDIWNKEKWDAAQWGAYCRAVLLTFRDCVEKGFGDHAFVLHGAMHRIEHAVSDLYKINGMTISAWDDDVQARLRVVVGFIRDAMEILETKEVPRHIKLRVRNRQDARNIYDYLAGMMVEVIFYASNVRSPNELCWWIQHIYLWAELFNFDTLSGPAAKVVKFKVRRLIYNEVIQMKHFPNFKGARILGFCLNVMGLAIGDDRYNHDSKALHIGILSWTKKNYAWLHSYNPRVAEACLVDGITYDEEHLRLVKTYPAEGLRREAEYIYFDVDPPS
ncbi:MAG: hypothetical protein AB1814_08870 [Thermodesulfobacteriota bacterium]